MCDSFRRQNWYPEICRFGQLAKLVYGYLFPKSLPSSSQGSAFVHQVLRSVQVPVYDSNLPSIKVSINTEYLFSLVGKYR